MIHSSGPNQSPEVKNLPTCQPQHYSVTAWKKETVLREVQKGYPEAGLVECPDPISRNQEHLITQQTKQRNQALRHSFSWSASFASSETHKDYCLEHGEVTPTLGVLAAPLLSLHLSALTWLTRTASQTENKIL